MADPRNLGFFGGETLFRHHDHPQQVITAGDLDAALLARIVDLEADVAALRADLDNRVAEPANTLPTLVEGKLFYEEDINTLWVAGDSAWGQVTTLDPWTSYTPTITQSAAINKTVDYSRWTRSGRMIVWNFDINLTSAGTAGQILRIVPPVAAAGANGTGVGIFNFYDASASTRYVLCAEINSNEFIGVHDTSGGTGFGAGPAVTVANGDLLRGQCMYEAASFS